MSILKKIFRSKIFLSFAVSGLIFGICMIIGPQKDVISDDNAISIMISRDNYAFIPYVNYILTSFLVWLNGVFPTFNTFVLYQVLLSWISLFAISYVVIDRFEIKLALLINLFINIITAPFVYVFFQYTQTAFLACAAGGLLIIHALLKRTGAKRIPLLVFSFFLMMSGTMLRKECFLPMLVMSCCYICVSAVVHIKNRSDIKDLFSHHNMIKLTSFLSVILVMLVSYNLLNVYTQTMNNQTEEMREYTEYNELRTSLNDYSYPGYEQNKEFYDNLGINEEDLDLYCKKWFQDCDGVFDTQTMEKIESLKQSSKMDSSIPGFLDIVNHVSQKFGVWFIPSALLIITVFGILLFIIYFKLAKKYPFKTCVISLVLISALSLLFGVKEYIINYYLPITFVFLIPITVFVLQSCFSKSKKWLIPVSMFAVYILMRVYLISSGRCNFRSLFGMIIFTIIASVYSIDSDLIKNISDRFANSKKIMKIFKCVFIAPFVIMILFVADTTLNYYNTFYKQDSNTKFEKYLNENKDNLYICDSGVVSDCVFRPLKSYSAMPDNYTSLGGWTSKSPYKKDMLKKYGVNRFMQDTIDNQRVLYAFKSDEETIKFRQDYFNRHYADEGEEIVYNLIDEVDGYRIYSLITVKEQD